MASVTFQVLEGIDKGRTFREMPTPVTIGREEGNLLRLNDDRVSRYHAKIQCDNGEIILTDLESTNGTRVNGNVVQIRRLRAGDRVGVGRSLLLFGTDGEIAARLVALNQLASQPVQSSGGLGTFSPAQGPSATLPVQSLALQFDYDMNLDLNVHDKVSVSKGTVFIGQRPLPPLPLKMSPSQAARIAELFDFLHRHLTSATENIHANDDASQITLAYADWQRVLAVQMVLARYVRAIAEPDILEE